MVLGVVLGGCGSPAPQEVAVREALKLQQRHWNQGNLEEFLEAGYWDTGSLSFLTGDAWYEGYEALRRSFEENYPAGRGMGQLQLSQLQTRPLGQSHVLVCGRWGVEVQVGAQVQVEQGVFTLVFEKRLSKWRIVHEHSSRDSGESHLDAPDSDNVSE